MKFVLLGILLTFSVTSFAKDVQVKVSGMVCSMCAQGIEKRFKSEETVSSIKVNLDTKIVTIQLKDGQDIDDAVIKKHITEAGYNVAEISR